MKSTLWTALTIAALGSFCITGCTAKDGSSDATTSDGAKTADAKTADAKTADAKTAGAETAAKKAPAAPSYPGDAVTGEPVETPSGLKYHEIKVGAGDSPNPTSVVEVHYSGWLTDGKQFDSSVKRGRPAQFPLNRVIGGWTEGVGSMKVGGKRKLIIPYQLGYGKAGQPRAGIPPEATLIFDVELLRIVKK